MSESASGYAVSVEDHDNVRVLVLDRPTKLNAFTAEGYRDLKAQLDAVAADPGVAVCVLTGRGRAFSAGVDLNEMSRPGGSAELGVDFDPLLDCLARFPKPLVAAVNGLAVGFGATLLLHCDLVVVDEESGDPHALRHPGHLRRGGKQLAPAPTCRPATGVVDDALGFAAERRGRRRHRVRLGERTGRARPSTQALTTARALAAHDVDALVANKALLRAGFADRITEVWQREKAAMAVDGREARSHRVVRAVLSVPGPAADTGR